MIIKHVRGNVDWNSTLPIALFKGSKLTQEFLQHWRSGSGHDQKFIPRTTYNIFKTEL